ncbi:hypothetical protein EF405_08935 [Cyclobacteriaceae bacterium YHN15]|nr:hypothetical protein EF405_08935 [Cyclobacteriaceae bacterium YHN15]
MYFMLFFFKIIDDCQSPIFWRIKEGCNIVCVFQSSNRFCSETHELILKILNFSKMGKNIKDG